MKGDADVELPLEKIFGALSNLNAWALLRNADIEGNYRRGGDCDLLVSDIEEAKSVFRRFLGDPIRTCDRSYVSALFYSWGHIDLCVDYYWKAVRLKSGASLLRDSSNRQDWPVISEADEAACILLNSLLWGGFVKKRYLDIVVDVSARRAAEMRRVLEGMLGRSAGRVVWDCVLERNWERLEGSVWKIRFLTLLAGVARRPLGTLKDFVHFVWRELVIRVRPGLPMMSVHLPRGTDIDLFEETLKEAAAVCEYKLLLREGAEGPLGWWYERLRWRSFRARNGLVVFWTAEDRSLRAPECIHLEVGDASVAGTLRMIREFQRRAAVYGK